MNVILVGNYPNDGQESMRRFCDLLALELPGRGIQSERLNPSPVLGRFHRSGNGFGKWLGYMDKFLFFPMRLRKRMRTLDPDSVVHICDHSNAVYTRYLADIPHLVTCHDLLAVRSALGEFPGRQTRASGRIYQRLILRGLNAAHRVACVSSATCRDLLHLSKLTSHQVAMVHNGLNYPYDRLPESEAAERLRDAARRLAGEHADRIETGFILHVGGNQWYKNRPGVIQIYEQLCRIMSAPPNLVMVGKPLTPELRRRIKTSRLEHRVIELNAVSNEDLNTLYCSARLLLFPSSEEGFGWPIIEAQACGCSVVIANREPMQEIGADAAVCFEFENDSNHESGPLSKNSVESAGNAVKEILSEALEAKESRVQKGVLNAARFSTARMLDGYTELYKQLLQGGSKSKRCGQIF